LGRAGALRKVEGGMWKSGGTVEVDVDANDDGSVLVSAVTWLVALDGFVTVEDTFEGVRKLPPEIIR
jgi:hypothetical protein